MKLKFSKVSFPLRKWLLITIMRTFIFLFCTSIFAFTTSNVVSQNSKVYIEKNSELTVDEIFDLVKNQTEYKFFYEEELFKDFPKIKLKKGFIVTNRLLKRSLSHGNFYIELSPNNTILIKENKPEIIELQEIEISGKILDSNGQPLPGASIIEKGTTNGTQTDFDGNFTLDVSDQNSTLVVYFLGFSTKEVP